MQLSVIIVNFNVKYFLEHCLLSVRRACRNISAEIIVIDNNSHDGSVEMIRHRFPEITLIANTDNPGFAKANNQGVAIARGTYILYLNPDTIVPEDCFEKCIQYMDTHPEAGALGCRLIDGKGVFLPESKRGFPSAQVAFFKISGLSALFPKSSFFNRYHLGHLSANTIAEVDVLVGCFMWCRRSVIEKVGSFDETYFMYGEDIDLSYKISSAGYKNIYFPHTTVIHYKGESTKKGSLNYVKMFYQAMIIFAKKHFKHSQKGLFIFLIQAAIYIRAILALFIRIFEIIKLPLLDILIMLGSLHWVKSFWIENVKTTTQYADSLLYNFFGVYILIWITSLYFNGTYDTPFKFTRLLRGMLIGAILSLALYGLMPESMRFSRGITVLSSLLATLAMLSLRKVLQYLGISSLQSDLSPHHRVLLVGTDTEIQEINTLLQKAHLEKNIVGHVSPNSEYSEAQLGHIAQLPKLISKLSIREVIYAQGQADFKLIIDSMQAVGPSPEFKIHSIHTDSIIGSNSKHSAGDLYTTDVQFSITSDASRRNKRMADILLAILLLILFPAWIFKVRNSLTSLRNILQVLSGQYTLVGYNNPHLPGSKPFLIPICSREDALADHTYHKIEWLYAKHYNVWHDFQIVWKRKHLL